MAPLNFPILNKNIRNDKTSLWLAKYNANKIPNGHPSIARLLLNLHAFFASRFDHPEVLDAATTMISLIDYLHRVRATSIWFDPRTRAIHYVLVDGQQGSHEVVSEGSEAQEYFCPPVAQDNYEVDERKPEGSEPEGSEPGGSESDESELEESEPEENDYEETDSNESDSDESSPELNHEDFANETIADSEEPIPSSSLLGRLLADADLLASPPDHSDHPVFAFGNLATGMEDWYVDEECDWNGQWNR